MDQAESESRAEQEAQHRGAGKAIGNGTTDKPQLPSSDPSSNDLSNQRPDSDNRHPVTESAVSQQTAENLEVCSEEPTAESQPVKIQLTTCESGGEDVKDPAAESEADAQKRETFLESIVVQETKKKSEAEQKAEVEEKDQTKHGLSGASKATDTDINLKENTNVLKLEREIHNEYFQAPLLGQTLSLQPHKSKSLEVESSCPPAAEKDANPLNEKKPEISKKHEIPLKVIKASNTDAETKDVEAAICDFVETKKATEISFEKPGSNSPVRQVLNALQSASLSLSSQSRQSPDTADSDDSPSALEMEDIPAGITYVTSEDIKTRPLAGLAAPPVSLAQREKMASEDLALDHHLDTACNTSPEGTDLGLSEEEPEIENVLTEPESAEVGGVTKYDESSEEQTYSVSVTHGKQNFKGSLLISYHTVTDFSIVIIPAARNNGYVLDQFASY